MTASERPARPDTADDDPTVRSVMSTQLVGIVPAATLDVALRLMVARQVRHLPVVDRRDHRRVVSEADLLRGILASHWSFALEPLRVEDAARPAAVVRPDDRLSAAARAMHRCGADVVLVEDDGSLVGMLTATDMIVAATRVTARGGPGRSS
ncbi:CBS domain-containing protein [Pseudonocardia sp.]|uniref:CBS domain-containing protein n=1 Tax=Pseudonocardia sp. TaxID=60912 RepID=UPI003D14EF85